LKVSFIGVKFIEFSSKWPAGSKLEMADMHMRQQDDFKELFLVRKLTSTIG
jgi:hypothetical protein